MSNRLPLYLSLFFVLATTYSVVTPIFESPDELWHYPFVWHLARTWELPVQDPNNPQLWHQEASQPPLYYAIAAIATSWINTDDLPELIYRNPHVDLGIVNPDGNINIVAHTAREAWPWQGSVLAIHIARLISVVLGTITIGAIYALARQLWPSDQLMAELAVTFVAFNPMFLFISGSVNNDNLIICLASLVLWRLTVLLGDGQVDDQQTLAGLPFQPPPARGRRSLSFALQVMMLAVLTGCAALTKISGLGLVGLAGLTLLWLGWQRRSWAIGIGANVMLVSIVGVIAGWWYWRNFVLYGDLTGTSVMVAMMGARPFTPSWLQLWAELPGFLQSFWGLFGYFGLPLPKWWYTVLNTMVGIGFACAILHMTYRISRAMSTQKPSPGRRYVMPDIPQYAILLIWIGVLCFGLYQWTLRTPATQGRLIFPAIGAIAVFWAYGWRQLPWWLWRVPTLIMFGLAVWVPFGLIGPAYATPSPMGELPASVTPKTVVFDGQMEWAGYQFYSALPSINSGNSGHTQDTVQLEQRDSLPLSPDEPITLDLYWRSIGPLDKDYSLFIHVIDPYGNIITQKDVWPGQGLYPTSQWTGDLFRDRHLLHIPRTAYLPDQVTIAIGWYDYQTGTRLLTAEDADQLEVGKIALAARSRDLPNPLNHQFEDGIKLVGYDLSARSATLGEELLLTLYWQATAHPQHSYKVFVHVVGTGDMRVAQHDSDPAQGQAPTDQWQVGEVIVDKHPLTIDATTRQL